MCLGIGEVIGGLATGPVIDKVGSKTFVFFNLFILVAQTLVSELFLW